MSNKKVYVLHQLEASSHYEGLKYFCERKGWTFQFNEFSISFQLKSGIRHLNKNGRFTRAIKNALLILRIIASRGNTIVLGIAPYDYRMIFFNWLAKRNDVYYHTSWPYWDGTRFPENQFHMLFRASIIKAWKEFLETRCSGIFCVSKFTEREIKYNHNILCPTGVVYHSLDSNIFFSQGIPVHSRPLKFLFVGRLVESKGLIEILNAAEYLESMNVEIGIVGRGPLADSIKQHQCAKSNLKFYGYLDRHELGEIYRQYDALICPSKKGSGTWEELFGMAIIEAMACGCIPIATEHIGPKEIIETGVDGFLISEENLAGSLIRAITTLNSMTPSDRINIRNNAIKKSETFYTENISERWEDLLLRKRNHAALS